jgi:hypothetical protein
MTNTNLTKPDAIVLGLSRGGRIAVIAGFALLAAAVGAAVPVVADWVLGLQWTPPLYGPLELIESWNRRIAVPVLAGVGLVAGSAFGAVAVLEQVVVTVSGRAIELNRHDSSRTVPRSEVSAVFLDGKHLVVLDRESKQFVRTKVEAAPKEIARAAVRHGYPWFDSDPHAGLFHRWVPDTPDLPPAANAVLAVRATALEKKSQKDIDDFRGEVEKLGVVVRDDKTAQYWRPLVRS